MALEAVVSVPLSGLVSVNCSECGSIKDMKLSGFRPLIGVSFCKQELEGFYKDTIIEFGFRPLIGVSFCKLEAWNYNKSDRIE